MTALRVSSVAWIVAAILAAPLGAFVLGMAEGPEARPIATFEVAGAIVAAVTGIIGLWRPSTAIARWSVLVAIVWLAVSFVGAPAYRFSSDRIVFVWLPVVAPVVAGAAALYALARSGSARRTDPS